MRNGRLLLIYATLLGASSACTSIAPTPHPTFDGTQTRQSPSADLQSAKPCLVGAPNCLSADQPPPGPCLASTGRCVTEGARVMEAMER
jgi:hypothetical protein